MNDTALIEKCDYFKGIPSPQVRRFASVCRKRVLEKRETLFLEETRGRSIFLLLEGGVQLSKSTEDGKDISIRTVKPGDLFAEVILFEKDRYPVTATALLPSQVLVCLKEDFMQLLDDRLFRNGFIRNLMEKQRYLAERIRTISAYDVEDRFFHFLCEQYGPLEEIVIPLPKKDIAMAIGTIPETFSRLLQRLEKRNVLRWEHNRIYLAKGFWDTFPGKLAR